MATEKTATFALDLKSNAADVAGTAKREVEDFRAKIEQAQASVKGMSGALRSLRGSSDEIAAAKVALKAKIDAERGAISQANLALLKHGVTYDQVAKAQQKSRTATDAVKAGVKAAGGPVGELSSRFEALKGVMSGGNAGAAALAIGLGALVVGVAAVTTGVIEAGIALGKFILTSADSLRSMQLLREGTGTSAKNAEALGTQVDRIARLVPTAKEEINKLGVSLVRSLSGGMSRANGQTIVDTFEAVSVASAAAGDQVGNTIKGLVERGKQWNRFSLTPQDLDNTGLRFGQVAEALAKKMHIGLEQAKAALFTGRVSLAAGAEALKDAVNARFGGVNAKQLLSVDVQLAKFKEHLVGLTKGVVLEPLLRGMSKVLAQFDLATPNGQKLATVFEKIGNAIVSFSVKHVDDVVKGISALVAFGSKVASFTTAVMGNRVAVESIKIALVAVGSVVVGIGALFVGFGAVVAGGLALAAAPIAAAGVAVYGLYRGVQGLWDAFKGVDLKGAASAIIDGFVGGLKAAWERVRGAVASVAEGIKRTFAGALQIRSPSKVFEGYGKQTAQGYALGMKSGEGATQDAANDMAPAAPATSSGRGLAAAAGGGGPLIGSVSVVFHLPPGTGEKKAEEIRAAVTAPDVLRTLARALREGLISQGIPTQAPVTP